ncbi:ABC transporter permease [Erysipelothrix sp. Poltava]|nr:ABC transporter permease [Erysipelothrix sp. Poltava]
MESEADLNAFTQQAKELLEDGLTVRTSQQSFEMIAAPMAMLNVMADYTLKGAAITTTIVLSLVVILFLRDRKHEMGIYIALGDRQWGVLGQVTLEVLMITLMGLTLSFGTGLMLANKVSDVLISDSYMDDVFIDTESSYLPSINMIEVNEDYRIELTPSYVLSVYLLGAGVAVASSILPMFYVTRMKPKKILM